MVFQNIHDGHQIRALRNRSAHVAFRIKDHQPGTHTVPGHTDIVCIDTVVTQLLDHILAFAGTIHHADKRRSQFHVSNILSHISAYAAVNVFHSPHIPARRRKRPVGISFNIHKYSSDHNNTHMAPPVCYFLIITHLCHFATKVDILQQRLLLHRQKFDMAKRFLAI